MKVLAQIFDIMIPDKHSLMAEVKGDTEELIKIYEARNKEYMEKAAIVRTSAAQVREPSAEAAPDEYCTINEAPERTFDLESYCEDPRLEDTPEIDGGLEGTISQSANEIPEPQTPAEARTIVTSMEHQDFSINPGRSTLEEFLKNPVHSEDPNMTQIDILKSNSIEIFYNLLILLNNVNHSTIRDFLCSDHQKKQNFVFLRHLAQHMMYSSQQGIKVSICEFFKDLTSKETTEMQKNFQTVILQQVVALFVDFLSQDEHSELDKKEIAAQPNQTNLEMKDEEEAKSQNSSKQLLDPQQTVAYRKKIDQSRILILQFMNKLIADNVDSYALRTFFFEKKVLLKVANCSLFKSIQTNVEIVKFFKVIIQTKDNPSVKYMINKEIFDTILEIFLNNKSKGNLLHSCILNLFEMLTPAEQQAQSMLVIDLDKAYGATAKTEGGYVQANLLEKLYKRLHDKKYVKKVFFNKEYEDGFRKFNSYLRKVLDIHQTSDEDSHIMSNSSSHHTRSERIRTSQQLKANISSGQGLNSHEIVTNEVRAFNADHDAQQDYNERQEMHGIQNYEDELERLSFPDNTNSRNFIHRYLTQTKNVKTVHKICDSQMSSISEVQKFQKINNHSASQAQQFPQQSESELLAAKESNDFDSLSPLQGSSGAKRKSSPSSSSNSQPELPANPKEKYYDDAAPGQDNRASPQLQPEYNQKHQLYSQKKVESFMNVEHLHMPITDPYNRKKIEQQNLQHESGYKNVLCGTLDSRADTKAEYWQQKQQRATTSNLNPMQADMSKQDQQQKVAEKDITGAAALNFSDADRSKNANRIVSTTVGFEARRAEGDRLDCDGRHLMSRRRVQQMKRVPRNGERDFAEGLGQDGGEARVGEEHKTQQCPVTTTNEDVLMNSSEELAQEGFEPDQQMDTKEGASKVFLTKRRSLDSANVSNRAARSMSPMSGHATSGAMKLQEHPQHADLNSKGVVSCQSMDPLDQILKSFDLDEPGQQSRPRKLSSEEVGLKNLLPRSQTLNPSNLPRNKPTLSEEANGSNKGANKSAFSDSMSNPDLDEYFFNKQTPIGQQAGGFTFQISSSNSPSVRLQRQSSPNEQGPMQKRNEEGSLNAPVMPFRRSSLDKKHGAIKKPKFDRGRRASSENPPTRTELTKLYDEGAQADGLDEKEASNNCQCIETDPSFEKLPVGHHHHKKKEIARQGDAADTLHLVDTKATQGQLPQPLKRLKYTPSLQMNRNDSIGFVTVGQKRQRNDNSSDSDNFEDQQLVEKSWVNKRPRLADNEKVEIINNTNSAEEAQSSDVLMAQHQDEVMASGDQKIDEDEQSALARLLDASIARPNSSDRAQ